MSAFPLGTGRAYTAIEMNKRSEVEVRSAKALVRSVEESGTR